MMKVSYLGIPCFQRVGYTKCPDNFVVLEDAFGIWKEGFIGA